MPIDKDVFAVNYNLMYERIHPMDCISEMQNSILRCNLTWIQAKLRSGFLPRLLRHAGSPEYCGKIIWFQEEDPYSRSKPFKILWIGLEVPCGGKDETLISLVVDGKKTERIKKKWTAKLTTFFGFPVYIIWEEDAQ